MHVSKETAQLKETSLLEPPREWLDLRRGVRERVGCRERAGDEGGVWGVGVERSGDGGQWFKWSGLGT